MLVILDPKDPRPIYTQIVDEVRRALMVGALQHDDPLPSVRQLAVDLRVNPNTVAQAYRELERQGLAYVRRGQGTYASQPSISDNVRHELAHTVALQAIQNAHRNGVTTDELITAIRAHSDKNLQEPLK